MIRELKKEELKHFDNVPDRIRLLAGRSGRGVKLYALEDEGELKSFIVARKTLPGVIVVLYANTKTIYRNKGFAATLIKNMFQESEAKLLLMSYPAQYKLGTRIDSKAENVQSKTGDTNFETIFIHK